MGMLDVLSDHEELSTDKKPAALEVVLKEMLEAS